jgi:hypothetical protein
VFHGCSSAPGSSTRLVHVTTNEMRRRFFLFLPAR